MPALGLDDLLNPLDAEGLQAQADMRASLIDVRTQLDELFTLSATTQQAPREIQQKIKEVVAYLQQNQAISAAPLPLERSDPSPPPPEIEKDIRLTSKTHLSILYRYPLNTIIEYPESGTENPIGHLFRLDPDDWVLPDLSIAYSRGSPGGQTLPGRSVTIPLLVDASGNVVECQESHSTCQGVKVCPRSDMDFLSQPHTWATREGLQERLQNDREDRLEHASPNKDTFCRTSAYLAALRKLGCCRPLVEVTNLSSSEEETREATALYLQQVQRGYRPKEGTCQGRLIFEYNAYGTALIRCEHYSKTNNRNHFHDNSVGTATGTYDLDYIEAVLCEDEEEIYRIEEAAFALGYGPLVECKTVTNVSAQRAFCPFDHREEDGALIQPIMVRLECKVKFRMFQPLEQFRRDCPFILITSSGSHTHPIPLPTKTPPAVRSQVFQLLETLEEDIPDMTPRRFLRSPVVKAFLSSTFPHAANPTLTDLHISLGNRSHLKAYIKQAKEFHCPFGTGWNGIVHLKALQDENLAAPDHYIRRIIAINLADVERHEEDDWDDSDKDTKLRIIICMYPKGSSRLLKSGQYLQSDIAFKRIVGYLEFELATMDRDSNFSVIFCRVFVNRQSAFAHQHIFAALEEIVFEDTGKKLRWRHLHAQSLTEYDDMILEWAGDQHRGQAKGLGLHLQSIAAKMPTKADLHEPDRTIQSLGPYEHLGRLFRLCSNHYYRNVKATPVSEEIRRLMRSLLCLEHPDWEGTLDKIRAQGGKAGNDWLRDKESCRFVFPAICWELSCIPWDIWRAGDSNTNLVESSHSDVNREGVRCTLLGGLQKGQAFDVMRLKSLETNEKYGIRPNYLSGHIFENALTNLCRRDNAQRRRMLQADDKIDKLNTKMRKTFDSLQQARFKIREAVARLCVPLGGANSAPSVDLEKLTRSADKTLNTLLALKVEGDSLANLGSGQIQLLTFDLVP
ncbi:hypothetical protein B0H16DRAFT_1718672 [Mycena metata]|uniref:Uncharacterized protein n=1 Tax=Mycena metata TaxID=1033252 RepID=A0AAD7JFN4_9AGAR|nr:hypothetical protein B0H16DRAFT_1718672 [Mycena metata]